MFLIIVNQISKMLLILIVGYICYRTKVIDQNGNKTMANLLLMVVNPMLAIMSLQTDYNKRLVTGFALSFLLAFLTHAGAVILTNLLIRKDQNPDYSIDRFCSMYSNCGFMGIPLVQSILGSEGVFYLTAYMIIFNFFSWTHGVLLMTGKATAKDILKGLLSPMLIASIVGLILFFLQIRLPEILADSMNYIAGMNTPLAMLIAGISVAQTDLKKMLHNKKLYLISAGKLLLMPALVLAALTIIPVQTTVAYTILIAAACPSAASGTAFALRFRKNYKYASEIYALTTLLALVTIPLFVFAAERLLV